jgi:hypothetical protein
VCPPHEDRGEGCLPKYNNLVGLEKQPETKKREKHQRRITRKRVQREEKQHRKQKITLYYYYQYYRSCNSPKSGPPSSFNRHQLHLSRLRRGEGMADRSPAILLVCGQTTAWRTRSW